MSKLPRRGQTDAWGIDDCYQDAFRRWHHTSDETRAALRTAMDADPSWPAPPADARVLFVHPDRLTCAVEPGRGRMSLPKVSVWEPRPISSTQAGRTGGLLHSSRGSCAGRATSPSSRPFVPPCATREDCESTTCLGCSACTGCRMDNPPRRERMCDTPPMTALPSWRAGEPSGQSFRCW